jgi:hypothetical protein
MAVNWETLRHVSQGIPVKPGDELGKLTDSSGGTADGTVSAVSGSGADTAINNNFKELTGKLNSIMDALGLDGR